MINVFCILLVSLTLVGKLYAGLVVPVIFDNLYSVDGSNNR